MTRESRAGAQAASMFDRAIGLAAALKHKRAFRALAVPAMTIQYARRDSAYAKSPDAAYIRALENSRSGGRCFLVGNGPSITASDLDALAGEETFASNGIFKVFGGTRWRPTYYLSVDREFIAHEVARFAAEQRGARILNATRGGELEVFERADLDEVLKAVGRAPTAL